MFAEETINFNYRKEENVYKEVKRKLKGRSLFKIVKEETGKKNILKLTC